MDLSQNLSENSSPYDWERNPQNDGPVITTLSLQLIEKVENRRFLYDQEDLKHKDKHLCRAAWKEIADELGVDATWCKGKWRGLRDYYTKKKRILQGKSGQGREKVKPWACYDAMAFLENCVNENEDTISNLENSESMSSSESPQGGAEVFRPADASYTPLGEQNRDVTKTKPIRKRRLETSLDAVNDKILKLLDTPEPTPTKNLNDRFGQRLAERLNNMHPATASYLCMKIENLCYEVEFPQYAGTPVEMYDTEV